MTRLVKVCGATCDHELDEVAAGGADTVGLWWNVGASPRSLPLDELADLAKRAHRLGIRPCLVTLSSDSVAIAKSLHETGITCVQMHAFQPPKVIERLVSSHGDGLQVLKVLHCTPDECVDLRYADAYARSGVSGFIIDAMRDGQIGSTGHRVAPTLVMTLLDGVSLPTLLAGGIGRHMAPEHRQIVDHEYFAGVDVDTAARNSDGILERQRISAIVETWGAH